MVVRIALALLALLGAGCARSEVCVYVVRPALTNMPILADEPLPSQVRAEDTVRLTACRGEYESASFLVTTDATLHNLRVRATGLEAVADLDICYVQELWQAVCWDKLMMPAALVHDLSMIEVTDDIPQWVLDREQVPTGTPDHMKTAAQYREGQRGVNRLRKPFIDPPTLVPADITGRQQYWLTMRVHDDAAAGDYAGTISIEADNAPAETLALRLRVLPFALLDPPQEFSLYYPTYIEGAIPEGHSAKRGERTDAQMLRDFRDMRAHGCNPCLYQNITLRADGGLDTTLLDRVLDLREQAGMPRGMLWLPDGPVHISDQEPTPERLADNTRWARMVLDWAHARGYADVGFMGCDEWSGERLAATRPWLQAIRDGGALTWVACYPGFLACVGDALSVPIVQHPSAVANDNEQWSMDTRTYLTRPDLRSGWDVRAWLAPEYQAIVAQVHADGNRIFCYMDPWGGQPLPEDHRRCRGVGLALAGLDGTMTWAYTGYAAPLVAYDPTPGAENAVSPGGHGFIVASEGGPVGSLQWEGYREGYDDARYLATLAALDGGAWFASLSPDYLATVDLDELRARMVRRILAGGEGE